jgi:heat shock protein HtpX
VSGEVARIPTQDLRNAQAFNAFLFAPALAEDSGLALVFSTHPSLKRRLDALGELSKELGELSQ